MKSACCSVELAGDSANDVPTWIRIWPKGPVHKTRDERSFKLSDPISYVEQLNESNVDIVVDYEHSTALLKGQKAPAAGWLKEFSERNGEVWGRVEWTEDAQELLRKKQYRYISPHFNYSDTGDVLNLWSVGLVNNPALNMEAICSTEKTYSHVDAVCGMAAALGLDGSATLSQITTAFYASLETRKNEAILAAVNEAREEMVIPAAIVDDVQDICRMMGVDKFKRFISILKQFQIGFNEMRQPQTASLSIARRDLTTSSLTRNEQDICKNVGVDEFAFLEERDRLLLK